MASGRPATAAPPRPLLLIVNANASGLGDPAEAAAQAARLLAAAGGSVETRVTSSVAEVEEALAHADQRRLVLVGGDGTVHAVANLPSPKPEVAILPVGGANNIATSLGIPLDPAAAAKVAVTGRPRELDLVGATSAERRYLAVEGVSVGFLAMARAQYRARHSADTPAAVRAGLSALRQFDPLCVEVETDAPPERLLVSQLFVANLPLYSFGLRVAPLADPGDGLLDLTAIEAKSRLALLPTLARLRRRPETSCPGYRCWRARRVRIGTRGASPIIADSENLGTGPVELEVEPAALKLVVPLP